MPLEEKMKVMQELEECRHEVEERGCEADCQYELQLWNVFMQAMGGTGTGGSPRYPVLYCSY